MAADHTRLDQAIEARTAALGMSFVELARLSGVSDVTIRNFRKGRGAIPRARNLRRLEQALQWASGSIDALLAGGDPTPIDGADGLAEEKSASEIRQLIRELEEEIQYLEPRYEHNRAPLEAHLRRQIATLQQRLDRLDR